MRFCGVLPFDYSSFFLWLEGDDDSEDCATKKKVEVVVHLVGHMGGLCRHRTLPASLALHRFPPVGMHLLPFVSRLSNIFRVTPVLRALVRQ